MATLRFQSIFTYIQASVYIKQARYLYEGRHVLTDDDYLPDITESMLTRYFPLMYSDYLLKRDASISSGVNSNADVSYVLHQEMARNALTRLLRLNRYERNLHLGDADWSEDTLNVFAKRYKSVVKSGQAILYTLYHEYGHSFFWQMAEYLEYDKSGAIKIKVNAFGGGSTEPTSKKLVVQDNFMDAVLSLAGIAAARFSVKGFRIYGHTDDTIYSKVAAKDDVRMAKLKLELAGVPKHQIQKATIKITNILESFFALLHIFNYYDWQTALLSDSEPTLKCSQNFYDLGFIIRLKPDHFKIIFKYTQPDTTLFDFIDLPNLAEDVGASCLFKPEYV